MKAATRVYSRSGGFYALPKHEYSSLVDAWRRARLTGEDMFEFVFENGDRMTMEFAQVEAIQEWTDPAEAAE